MRRAVGLDFGTTNSAVAILGPNGAAQLATFCHGGTSAATLRSVLYLNPEQRGPDGKLEAVAGPEAIARYLTAETRGPLMQSLKSHLASALFRQTYVSGVRYTPESLATLLLRALRQEAEVELGDLGTTVVVGRPVRFAGMQDAADEARALTRLQHALEEAGFSEIVFECEPVAAAYEYERRLDHDELIVIADFGGGTSDFSLMQVGPTVRQRGHHPSDILGTAGVPLAGDAFDSQIVRHLIAPRLGRGSQYRSAFQRVLPVPSWLYTSLERWHELSFLKSPQTMRLLNEVRAHALEPEKIKAFIHLIDQDLGFHLSQAVEQTKITLSTQECSQLLFRAETLVIEEEVTRGEFERWIAEELAAIASGVDDLLLRTGITPREVSAVFLTGGSSFVPAVRRVFAERFGEDRLRSGDELTSVARGLALRAGDLFD